MAKNIKKVSFILEGIDKLSIPFRAIGHTSGELKDQFKDTKKSLNELQAASKKLESFKKLSVKHEQLKKDFLDQTAQVDKLSLALKNTIKPTKAQREELRKASAQLKQTDFQIDKSNKNIVIQSDKLKELGIESRYSKAETKKLKEEQERLNKVLSTQEKTLDRVTRKEKEQARARRKLEKVKQSSANLSITGQSSINMGLGIGRAIAGNLQTGIDFDASQSNVAAKLGLNKASEDMQKLRQMSIELGSETSFSSSEVSAAQEKLAMAGVEAKAITKDVLGGLLDVSLAGNLKLEDAASLSLSVLQGFGKSMDELSKVGDILTFTANNANTDLSEMTEVFKTVGPVAKTAGVSLEQVSGMIGVMANVGVKGSIAGTAIKNTMLNLSSPSKEAALRLKEVGVEVHDVSGNLRPLSDVFQELSIQTKEMGNAEKTALFEKIGGREAIAGFTSLIDKAKTLEGVAELRKVEDRVNDGTIGGYAKKQGKVIADNLKGDLTLLSSAWQSLSLVITDTVEPAFRVLVKGLTSSLGVITKLVKEQPVLTKMVVGFGVGLSGLLVVGGSLLTFFASMKLYLAYLSFGFGALKSVILSPFTLLIGGMKKAIFGLRAFTLAFGATGIGAIILGLSVAAGALYYYWDDLKGLLEGFFDKVKPYWESFAKWAGDIFSPLFKSFKSVFKFFKSDKDTIKIRNEKVDKIQGLASNFVGIPQEIKNKPGNNTSNQTVNSPITFNITANDPLETGNVVEKKINKIMEDLQLSINGRLSD